MGYTVEILRKIKKEEVVAALGEDDDFTIEDQTGSQVSFFCVEGGERTYFQYARGIITIERMGEEFAWSKTQQLARKLGADVLEEEEAEDIEAEDVSPSPTRQPFIVENVQPKGDHIGCGWWILWAVLAALLIWRW